jgi:ribose 5-phosphate isomerase B
MRIAIGSDHRGYDVKRRIRSLLEQMGHEVLDFGPDSNDSVDYPDFAFQVGRAVAAGQVERGILVCGTGIGPVPVRRPARRGVDRPHRAAVVGDRFRGRPPRPPRREDHALRGGESVVRRQGSGVWKEAHGLHPVGFLLF